MDEQEIIEIIKDIIHFNEGTGIEELFMFAKNRLVDSEGLEDIDDDYIRAKINEVLDGKENQEIEDFDYGTEDVVETDYSEMYSRIDEKFIKNSLKFVVEDLGDISFDEDNIAFGEVLKMSL